METPVTKEEINRVMRGWSRMGAAKGGKQCLETMTKKQRTARAKKAAKARWSRAKNEPCATCNNKGFVNPDGSAVNTFEGSDTDPVIPCPDCPLGGKPKPPASA